jgi:hypothetical protein
MDVMVRLSGEHSLDKVLDIAKHNSESVVGGSRACKRFDLDTLHDGGQISPGWAIEDCFEGALVDAGGSVTRHPDCQWRRKPQ